MQIRVVVNPSAGSAGDDHLLDRVHTRLRAAGHDVGIHQTAAPGDAERVAREAAGAGAGMVVAAGGDGTLNEVLNGVAAAGSLAACAIGILPLGTGNDFARALGLTDTDIATAALTAGRTTAVDVVSLGDRLFLNASAGGFTAETSANVTSDLKQAVGPLAYVIGGARALLEHEPVPARVEADGRVIEADLRLFAVCNGPYIGGGHQLAPSARPDDGLMEVCLVRASSTLDFLALLPRLSTGEHIDDQDVVYFRTREATLTFPSAIRVNTDGELLEAARCHYRIRPGAVTMVVPDRRGDSPPQLG